MEYDTIDLLSDMDLEMLYRWGNLPQYPNETVEFSSAADIGEECGVKPHDMTAIYQRLYRLRLIENDPHDSTQDYIEKRTRITEKGRAILSEYAQDALTEGTLLS